MFQFSVYTSLRCVQMFVDLTCRALNFNFFSTNFTGAYLNTIKRTVKFLCPAEIVPPYIDVDLSELDVGQKLVMGDLKVHPALKLVQSKDLPVCKIAGARVSDQKRSK